MTPPKHADLENGKHPWGAHAFRIGTDKIEHPENPVEAGSLQKQKKIIEPWLSAVFQSEHLALLLGNGFTTAIATEAGVPAANMKCDYSGFPG